MLCTLMRVLVNAVQCGCVGAFNTGASYLSCLAAGMLVDLFGCRILTLTGTVLTCVGTFLAAFAKVRVSVLQVSLVARRQTPTDSRRVQSHLEWIFTFGVLTGIGNGFLFVATPAILPEYFDKRIGLANAAVSLGSAIAFIIYPLIFQYNLEQHVHQKGAAAAAVATQSSVGASSTSPLQSTMFFMCAPPCKLCCSLTGANMRSRVDAPTTWSPASSASTSSCRWTSRALFSARTRGSAGPPLYASSGSSAWPAGANAACAEERRALTATNSPRSSLLLALRHRRRPPPPPPPILRPFLRAAPRVILARTAKLSPKPTPMLTPQQTLKPAARWLTLGARRVRRSSRRVEARLAPAAPTSLSDISGARSCCPNGWRAGEFFETGTLSCTSRRRCFSTLGPACRTVSLWPNVPYEYYLN